MLRHVAIEVSKCLHSYFSARLSTTGFLSPVNVQVDKGTNCRRIRQFTSITVVPNSKNNLSNIHLGQPIVKTHDGSGISSKISSRRLIPQLIGKEKSQKFKNMSAITHNILTACVKISVEGVVETLVSGYEHHFTPS